MTTKVDWPPRALLAVLFGALVILTGWAFTTGDVSDLSSPAGVRANPSEVYDPVAAGEPLPEGFRQLLPRDGIAPIYDPTFVPSNESPWVAGTEVIGVTINGESKAYPVSFLNGRELVVDELGGEPILVSW